jgi:hypothetical protein
MSTEPVTPSLRCLQPERVCRGPTAAADTALDAVFAARRSPAATARIDVFPAPPHLAFGGTDVPPSHANP